MGNVEVGLRRRANGSKKQFPTGIDNSRHMRRHASFGRIAAAKDRNKLPVLRAKSWSWCLPRLALIIATAVLTMI